MRRKLDSNEIADALAGLDGWRFDESRHAIEKTFTFADFNAAFGFMSRVAMLAEKRDHHPEWSNVYRTVNVVLTTHDRDGVTGLDLDMARAMDSYAKGP